MCDVAHAASLLRARGGAAAGRRCACARESARKLGCSAHARVSVLGALTRASVSASLSPSRVGDRPVDAPKSAGRRVSPPCFWGCVAPRRFPSCSRYASGPGGRVGGSLFVVGALAGPAWEGGGAAALLARCGGCRCPCRYTPASKMRARPCAAQYPAHRGPVFGPAFAWRHRRAFVWFSVSRFKHGVPNPFFLAFCHGTGFEMMAILVKALKCVTKRLRAFP